MKIQIIVATIMVSGLMMAGARTDFANRARAAQATAQAIEWVLDVGEVSAEYTVDGINDSQTRQDLLVKLEQVYRSSDKVAAARSLVSDQRSVDNLVREWQYQALREQECWNTVTDLELMSSGI